MSNADGKGNRPAIPVILGVMAILLAGAHETPFGAAPPPLQAPFGTALPWTLPDRSLEIACEGISLREEPAPFGGALRSRGALLCDLSGGLGERVEGSIQVGVQDLSGLQADEGIVASDLRLAVQYALAAGSRWRPSTSASFVAKVPTAPDSAGTDEADLGARLAVGWRGHRSGQFITAGIDLLGNPRRNGSQDDTAVYGAGFWWETNTLWRASAELEGRAFSRFDNSGAFLRLGAQWQIARPAAGRIAFHGAVARGLNADAAEWEARVGFAWAPP